LVQTSDPLKCEYGRNCALHFILLYSFEIKLDKTFSMSEVHIQMYGNHAKLTPVCYALSVSVIFYSKVIYVFCCFWSHLANAKK